MIDIDVLISKINIVDYIGQYADLIKKNGAYWCCSPLNPNDTDPSFEISEELQRFYDFSTENMVVFFNLLWNIIIVIFLQQ